MKKIKNTAILLAITIFACSGEAFAQSKEEDRPYNNINIGVGLGSLTEKIVTTVHYTYDNLNKEDKIQGYELSYDSRQIRVGYERVWKGAHFLFEGKYIQAKYDASALNDYTNTKYLLLDHSRLEDLSIISGMVYFGPTIFHGKRFQIPLDFGVGLTHISGYPIDAMHVEFGYGIRAKFYITDKICVYAGFSGGIAPGKKKYLEGNLAPQPSNSLRYSAKPKVIDAGISFMIGRAKKSIEDW